MRPSCGIISRSSFTFFFPARSGDLGLRSKSADRRHWRSPVALKFKRPPSLRDRRNTKVRIQKSQSDLSLDRRSCAIQRSTEDTNTSRAMNTVPVIICLSKYLFTLRSLPSSVVRVNSSRELRHRRVHFAPVRAERFLFPSRSARVPGKRTLQETTTRFRLPRIEGQEREREGFSTRGSPFSRTYFSFLPRSFALSPSPFRSAGETYLGHVVGGTSAIRHSTLPRRSRTCVPRRLRQATTPTGVSQVACPSPCTRTREARTGSLLRR